LKPFIRTGKQGGAQVSALPLKPRIDTGSQALPGCFRRAVETIHPHRLNGYSLHCSKNAPQ
jgi:hypothetical protein